MESYYALSAHIRYYGQLPRSVKREWESVYDAAGKSVRREIVLGEMDFTTDGSGSVVEIDGEPRGFRTDVRATPFNVSMELNRRKEPVHEALANLSLDSASLYAFTKRWGFLAGEVDVKRGHFRTRAENIQPDQDFLRRAWRSESRAIEEMAKDVTARLDVTPTGGVDIAVDELWNLVRLLFLRDYAEGRIKVCANKDCISPYFLEQRKGQKYCSHKCAVLINVRRFRDAEAKRKSQLKRRAKR